MFADVVAILVIGSNLITIRIILKHTTSTLPLFTCKDVCQVIINFHTLYT